MACQCKTDKQRAKCVWWVAPEAGFLQTNTTTGEQRLATGCFPDLALDILRFVVKTNSSVGAAVESTRNVIAGGLARVAEAMPQIAAQPGGLLINGPEKE